MSVADSRRPFRLCDVAVPQSDVRLVSSQDIMGSRSQLKLSSGQQVQIFKGYFAVEGSNCRRKGFLVVGDPGSRPKTGSLSGSQASLADLIQLQKPRTKERSKSAEGLRLPSKPLGSHASLSRLADSPQSDLAGNRESRWSGFRDRVKSAIASPQIGRRNTSGSRTPQRPAGRFVSPSVERKSELDWRPEVPKRTTSLNSLNAEFIAEEDNKSVVETIYAAVQKEKSKDFKQPGDEDNSVRPDLPPRRYSHDAKQSESQENASPKEISPQVDSTSPLSPPPKPPRSILKKKSREEYDWTPAIVPVDLEQIATEDADLSCPPMVQSTLPSDFTVATLTYDIGCLLIPYQTDASQVTETSSSNQPLAIGLLRYFSPIKDVSLPQLLDDSQTLPANIESLQRCESCEDLVASDLIELNSVKSSDIEVEPSIDSAGVELNDVRDEKPTEVEGKDLAPFADNIHFPQESVIADNFDVPEANENLNESSDRLDEPFLPPDLSEKEITEVPVTNIDELMSQLNLINLEDSEALSNESIEEGESSLEDLMARADAALGLLRQLKSAAKDSDDEDVQSIRDRLVLSRADSQLSAASGEETSLESQVFPPSMPILTLNFDQLMEEVPLPVCPAIIPPKDIVSQSAADSSDNWSQNNLWPSSEESDVDCQSDSESLLTEIGNIRSSLMELNNLIQPEEEVTEVEQSCTTMTTNSADAPALSGSYLTTLEQAIERHLEILGSPQSHLQSPAFSQQADFGDVDDKSVDQSLKVAKPNPPIPLDLTFDHLLFNLLCPKEKTTGMGCQVDNFCQTDVLHPPEAIFPAVDADTQTSEESQKIDTNSSMKEALIEDIHHSQLTNDGLEPTSFSRDPEVSLLRMEDTDGWEELEDFDPVIWQLADQFGQNHADGLSPISEEFLEESDDDNISFDVSRGENCDLDDEQFWEGRITPISAGEPYVDFIPRENQSEAGDAIPLHVAAQLKPVSNQPFTQQTNSIPPDDCELLASDSSEVSSQCGIIRKRSSQKLRAGKKPMKLHYVDSFSSDLPSDIQSDNSREATLERNHESQVGWLANVTAYLNPWKGFCPLVTKRTIGNSPTTTVREEAKSPVDFRVFYTLPRAAQPSDEPQKASSKLRRSAPVKRINKTVIAVAQQSRHAGVKVGRSDSADSLDSNFNTFPRVNRRQRSDAVVFERPSETGGLVLTRDLPRAKLLQLKVNDRPDDRDQLNDVPMMPDENFCRSNVIKGVSNGPLQPYTDRQSKMVGDKLIRRALEDQNDLATVEITRL